MDNIIHHAIKECMRVSIIDCMRVSIFSQRNRNDSQYFKTSPDLVTLKIKITIEQRFENQNYNRYQL